METTTDKNTLNFIHSSGALDIRGEHMICDPGHIVGLADHFDSIGATMKDLHREQIATFELGGMPVHIFQTTIDGMFPIFNASGEEIGMAYTDSGLLCIADSDLERHESAKNNLKPYVADIDGSLVVDEEGAMFYDPDTEELIFSIGEDVYGLGSIFRDLKNLASGNK